MCIKEGRIQRGNVVSGVEGRPNTTGADTEGQNVADETARSVKPVQPRPLFFAVTVVRHSELASMRDVNPSGTDYASKAAVYMCVGLPP